MGFFFQQIEVSCLHQNGVGLYQFRTDFNKSAINTEIDVGFTWAL